MMLLKAENLEIAKDGHEAYPLGLTTCRPLGNPNLNLIFNSI
jgi:hypothetical protein